MSTETVFVKILDKEFQVACPDGEQEALREAARNLDVRMRDIRKHGSVIGLERIAIMAALNLSHELQQARSESYSQTSNDEALSRLTEKLDKALTQL